MRRFASRVFVAFFISLCFASLSGCGSSNPVGTSTTPTPTKVALSPGDSSLDLGATLLFNATLTPSFTSVPVVYTSSNPSVLSFVPSAGGLACAGKWDTLAHVCTPQGAGVTQVTATASGVTSAPVTVYVHEHVDQITLSLINPPVPQPDCITLAQGPGIQNFLDFQAHAFRLSGGVAVDITNTVGSFTFSQTNSAVARLSTSDPALNNNNGKQVTQARFTAAIPGLTQIFASIAGVTSLPAQVPDKNGVLHPYFETCLVQSVNLQVGNAATNTSFAVASNTSGITITPTVVDRLGNELKNPVPPLTFISSSPPNATLSGSSTATTSGTANVSTKALPGGVSITAECFAPTCNAGLQPIQPVYSSTTPSAGDYVGNPIVGLITGAPPNTGTVYVTTTQCETGPTGPISECQPLLFPIDIKTNAPGISTTLPSSPNSLVFAPVAGTGTNAAIKAYLGSSAGLMIFSAGTSATAGTVNQLSNVPGKVLAVSLDGDKVVVSDIKSIPNQVYIVSGLTGSSTNSVPLLISGVNAAAFSPDGLKAFLIGGSTMYVYSASLALKTVTLPTTANTVSFYANGSLAYLAGPNGVTMRNACDTTYAQAAAFPGRSPVLFRALADGVHALGIESPGLDVFNVDVLAPPVATTTSPTSVTCPFTVGSATSSFVNLGQGTFTPLKLLAAPDNSRAYILASNLGSVFLVDLGVNAVSAIPLTGNPVPLDASLTPDGSLIYVGANDGSVHVVSTISGGDLQQITFSNDNNSNKTSLCSNIPQTCNADLVAVQP